MVDNEKQENLANARRKLKKFRDQQPSASPSNGRETHPINGINESTVNYNIMPGFVGEQRSTPNGTHPNSSKSPIIDLKEQTHLENQRRLHSANAVSGRTSQISVDTEQKLRRDVEHLQEQLEIHVQTIGILVAEKTDVSAKLTQSFKQLERKQSEMDELYGRLKASRERVQELEKEIQNSTSNVQKREMAAKESDKENDRLKIENIRQSQLIEDFKQNINQLNTELEKLKKSTNETSGNDGRKNTQIEELVSSLNRLRSDNEQYQQYNTNMQHHIQELTDQINQLNRTNHMLKTQYDTMKTNQGISLESDNLRKENDLLRNAIDQWSNRYEELKLKFEDTTKLLKEKDEHINMNQHQETQTEKQSSSISNDEPQEQIMERFHQTMHENTELKERIQDLEHTILQLQSETDTIGDYIHLYQQQREQLQKRYQEKDEWIKQLTDDRIHLQKKISELESLFTENLNQLQQINPSTNEHVESIKDGSSRTDSGSLPQLSDETKARILSLIQETQNSPSPSSNSKKAFVDKNPHKCSTCSGAVQLV